MPVSSRLFPCSFFFSYFVCLALCWGLCYLYHSSVQIINIDLFAFFYMQASSLTSIIFWRYCLFSSVFFCWLTYQKSGVHRCVDLHLGLGFDFIENCVCFYVVTMWFLSLQLCSTSGMEIPTELLLFYRIAYSILGFLFCFVSIWSWVLFF